jgi:hypothetical protein
VLPSLVNTAQHAPKFIATDRGLWCRIGLTLALWTVSTASGAFQNAASALSWEQVRPGLRYARQDIAIEGKEAIHRLHWLQLELATPDLYLALTPQACAGLQLTTLDSAPVVASLNASFFTRDFFVRGHTVSQGTPWTGNLRTTESPLVACTPDRSCKVIHRPVAAPDGDWHNAAAGVHSLVQSGQPRTDLEDAQCGNFCTTPHPRSAMGLDAAGQTVWWVAAEGRQKLVTGLPLAQLARLMASMGVIDAINLDGGGSTAMHVGGVARTQRPDNEPQARRIANAWVLSAQPEIDWPTLCQKPQKTPP